MFEENNTLVTEEVTENVEQATEELVDGAKVGEETVNATENEVTTEEAPKLYTEAELQKIKDDIKKNAKKNAERKIRREYESKYGDLENVLKAGTGISDVKELTDTFTDFYASKGKQIPTRNNYSESDLNILASAEAEDIISSGFEEVVEEVDRLAEKGLENMNPRERIMFQKLATYRQNKERENELASIGVTTDVLNNTEFTNFAKQFNSNVPIKDVYTMWTKTQPKPKVEQMGSMKNTAPNKVKDHYTEDEISRLTLDDLKDPNVWNAVRKSMTGQN